jgi:NADP-dependent 3-hydroxy acid dehydrogenase YdfG
MEADVIMSHTIEDKVRAITGADSGLGEAAAKLSPPTVRTMMSGSRPGSHQGINDDLHFDVRAVG